MKVDTKFYFYEEDKENLVKDWKIKFPMWDIWIRRAYKEIWSGDINYEEIRFSGDGEDFNEWLKIKWYERYRNLDWMEEAETKSPEEYNKVLQNIKELGIIEPIVIQVGINGQAVVADGNHRLAVAQQLNIKEIPVRFEFLQDEVRKANKITLEPGEISTPTEETEKDSYYMR